MDKQRSKYMIMYRFDKLKKIMKREMRIFPIGKREKGKE